MKKEKKKNKIFNQVVVYFKLNPFTPLLDRQFNGFIPLKGARRDDVC